MKRLLLALSLALLIAAPARAAIAATMQWDVRTGGVDTNGGGFDASVAIPGQDFSQQNAAQVAFTDLIIGATTTQLTSALSAFATCTAGVGRCGNVINITGGAGCTVGWYEILSTSTITATMDRSVGTAASTCTGNLGGSLLTIAKGMTLAVSNNTIHVKSGTYTFTVEQSLPAIILTIRGYGTTHNDGGTRPTWQTATTTINGVNQVSGGQTWIDNLILNYSAGGSSAHVGIYGSGGATNDLVLTNVKVSNWIVPIYGPSGNTFSRFVSMNSEFTGNNSATFGAIYGIFPVFAINCYFHGNVYDFKSSGSTSNAAYFRGCVFYAATNAALREDGSHLPLIVSHSVFYGQVQQGIDLPGGAPFLSLDNNVFYGITGGSHQGINAPAGQQCALNWNNAFGGNNANYIGIKAGMNEITLTGDPFTNAASADYTLNNTAGAGASLRSIAFPTSTPMGLNYEDTGALRHQDPAGSGGTHGYTFSRNKLPDGELRIW